MGLRVHHPALYRTHGRTPVTPADLIPDLSKESERMGWSRNTLYPEQDTGPLGGFRVTGFGSTQGAHPSSTRAVSD